MASEVTLNDIALDIDPENYELLSADRRGSVHKLITGDTVFQDRGAKPNDLVITISGKFTSKETLKALWALNRLKATSFDFADFKDNRFTVIFTPGQNSFEASTIQGSDIGFAFRISLSVISVDRWFGVENGYPVEE